MIQNARERVDLLLVRSQSYCPLCYLKGSEIGHTFNQCRIEMFNHCCKCHQVKEGHDCPLKDLYKVVDPACVCTRCFLPLEAHMDGQYHGKNCTKKGSDTLRPLCAQIWFLTPSSPLKKAVFSFFSLPENISLLHYFKWLGALIPDAGTTNLGLVALVVTWLLDTDPIYKVNKLFA